jgi:hypothetical protein
MRRYEMENFYEIATIALGIWVVKLHLDKKRARRMVFKLTTCIDKIAHRKWEAFKTDEGFQVVDSADGEVMLGVRDADKARAK